jgi:hypothetical protein
MNAPVQIKTMENRCEGTNECDRFETTLEGTKKSIISQDWEQWRTYEGIYVKAKHGWAVLEITKIRTHSEMRT